jgi:copper chaperone NosL
MKILSGTILLSLFLIISTGHAMDTQPVKPQPGDRCPVCGMFVAEYPDWGSEIMYQDGTVLFFDGAKDLFKFYFAPQKFKSDKKHQNIKAIYVTEYYDLSFIDATNAFYVIGSDVLGPMGRELIPFKTEKDAREFLRDHQGKEIILFTDVDPHLIKTLDQNP